MVTRYIKDAFLYGAGDSIVGQVRKANEDNCGYRKTINGELFVVCDGMGGHVGGATASHIAVNSILDYISQHSEEDKRIVLHDALMFANMQILGAAAQDPSLKGMGTTACIALVDAQNIWIAHVGDSRIYLYSESEKYLYRITKDHSLVQALVDKGELDDRDAEHHPQKNIILRALGTKQDVEPEVDSAPVRAQVGDTILICSDGLSGMIDDNEIEAFLQKDVSLEDKVQNLIDAANAPGKGKDNITVQLIQVLSSPDNLSAHPNWNPGWRRKGSAAEVVTTAPVSPSISPSIPTSSPASSGVSSNYSPIQNPTPANNKKRIILILSIVSGILACMLMIAFIVILVKNSGDKKTDKNDKEGQEVVTPILPPSISDTETTAQANAEIALAEAQKAEAEAQKAEAEAKKAEEERRQAEEKTKQEKEKTRQENARARQAEEERKKVEAEAKRTTEANAGTANQNAGVNTQTENGEGTQSNVAATNTKNEGKPQAEEVKNTTPAPQNIDSTKTPQNNNPVIKKSKTMKKGTRELTFDDIFGITKEECLQVDWNSANNNVAEVTQTKHNRGVKRKNKGKTVITGKKDGKEKYKLTVTVE